MATKPTNCQSCEKSAELTTHYPTRPTIEESVAAKLYLCPECYGAKAHPQVRTSFHSIGALWFWNILKDSEFYNYYNSIKIYQFNSRAGQGWAWAIVINGDYNDIREGHIASAVADGSVPDCITYEQLVASAKKEWYANSAWWEQSNIFSYIETGKYMGWHTPSVDG
jgi:hypothetical protein